MKQRSLVALFSGVNVGGKRAVKMAELRGFLEELGYEDVATYVQSGNAVFLASDDDAAVETTIEAAFAERWGFSSRVLVRDLAWFSRMVRQNPFAAEAEDPSKVHAFVLERAPDRDAVGRLEARNTGTERFAVIGDVLYLYAPEGIGRSKFAQLLPRALGVACTARNWRSVQALLAMLEPG